ncbi:anaerobic ribonucleoside triphosphate reductase [Clostridium botulinum]|uniref:Anaerobic ribonucleoside-triphosphate reductase n=1 Tax=Clostridium botulinum (strain Kyoto / Type A2) TaxID=536232 RepID=C1FQ52_CLOBJ|nr:anaerobic ribonucleoside triphosphate reductase [Clostridium botulinum]ACO84673.1 anaerobic ribonucleoside-triphosphate reductase [Clostridium botulinum A2 str. Kyoto]APH23286.1 anaerobic ribonucleoside-triphosphate reductase [Clostridium botulinum]APQ69887.1 anaerobic ribonucleoside-triphosphate reductase [Clostridium botulinum]APQ75925.1 anaerobic ribonucleoside-triphosphate reductase [Clostridium botulinum]AUM97606.1 anaerobic ribonucleoside triphosphate reductase [Clostridium botulinum]
MLYVVKRDGRKVEIDVVKISNAIKGAAEEIAFDMKESENISLTQKVIKKIEDSNKEEISVEDIQNLVEHVLIDSGFKEIGYAYSNYRRERTKIREIKSELMTAIEKIGVETDRDNANVGNNFSSKLLRIASESNKWYNLGVMPKHLAKLHENGDIYYHDLDSYNLTVNCLNIDTGRILQRGFNTGYGTINAPKRIESAAELSCILLQSTQNDMFGGQAHVNFDNDMALFIPNTRSEIRKEILENLKGLEVQEEVLNKEKIDELVEERLRLRIHQAMQGIVYNLNTMHSRAGSQVPFSSINIGIPKNKDAALICEIFLKEYEKGLGKGEQPIFPNIIFRVKEGVNREEKDPYYYLFKLAAKIAGKRMNPTFMNMDSDFNKEYYDKGIIPATMGCRTYVCSNISGEEGPAGRGNIAPTTINLPRVGILAKKDINKFFNLLDNRLELARESLLHRYNVLKKLRVKDLPFVVGEGLMKGSENLLPDDSIEPILKQGSWAIGFIGIAETLTALIGSHHGETEEAKELGVKIVSHIRDFCDKYKEIDKLNWSCYATPAEGLSGKFILQDKKVFGEIKGVTDKNYYTNSYHIPVGFPISIKEKINIEAPYHKICNGGHISYIELDDYPSEEVIMDIIQYAYRNTNISYMGINFHIKYCRECGTYLGVEEEACNNCGSTNIQGISRVTGYLSLDERFGSGKVAERADRTSNNSSHRKIYNA